jgi:hypothetical protein
LPRRTLNPQKHPATLPITSEVKSTANLLPHSVSVANECIEQFNQLKLGKSVKYIIYKLSDDFKTIVVEEASNDSDWEKFREKLINAKSKNKAVSSQYCVL